MTVDYVRPKEQIILYDNLERLFKKLKGLPLWDSSFRKIRNILFHLALTYIRSDTIEGANSTDRSEIAFNLYLLNNLTDDMLKYGISDPAQRGVIIRELIEHSGMESYAEVAEKTLSDLTLEYIKFLDYYGETKERRKEVAEHLALLAELLGYIKDTAY